MEEVCLDRLQRFGTEGNADRIKPLTLTQMSNKYLNNEFTDQSITATARYHI